MRLFKRDFIFLIALVLLMISCETKDFDEQGSNPAGESLNESSFDSLGYFEGIKSVTGVSDSSVILNWKESDDAKEYYVYDLSGGTPILADKIAAPASKIQVDNLKSGKLYTFNVKIKDAKGLLDRNQVSQSVLTKNFPGPPYLILKSFPVKFNDIERNPKFIVYGVNPGDTVSLHSNSSCTSEIAKGKATSGFIELESSSLTPGSVYNVYAKRKNVSNKESSCSTVYAAYNLLKCPDGYLEVGDNNALGINPFCVMKYEAKAWSDLDSDNVTDGFEVDTDGCGETSCSSSNWGLKSYKPGSTYICKPWRMLDSEAAKKACKSLGKDFDLISNSEWMVIAEEVEANPLNWSGGAVGTGCVYQGNTGVNSACSYNISSIDQGLSRDSKAIHTLKNGEQIWDFSGNVAEWVDWGKEEKVTRVPVTCNDPWGEIDSDFCSGNLLNNDFLPFNPANIPYSSYGSSYGIGQVEGGVGGYAVRGGAYQYGNYAGIYSLSLSLTKESARAEIGFRCVYRLELY